jgi:hypothetical protein
MSRLFDRLPARDQRRILGLIEHGLEFERRFERAAAILAYEGEELPQDLRREVYALVHPVLNNDPEIAREEIQRIAREHAANTSDVTLAILRHLVDWTSLDAASRSAAIREELEDRQLQEMTARLEAIMAQTGPFSAFDFPWGLKRGEAILEMVAQEGFIRDTGERCHGDWHVYELVRPEEWSEASGP